MQVEMVKFIKYAIHSIKDGMLHTFFDTGTVQKKNSWLNKKKTKHVGLIR